MTNTPDRKDLGARVERLERAVENLGRRSSLSSASISEGDLTIRRGGSIIVKDGGNVIISGGGGLSIADGGDISLDGGDLSINEGAIEITGAGGIVVKDGGDIQVQDGGDIIVSGTGVVRSSDYVANTSGWRIANGSAEFNTITLRNGIVGVDALNRRSEGRTFVATGSANVNNRVQSVTVSVPSWATDVSVMAIGLSTATLAGGIQLSSDVTISANVGPTLSASSDLGVTITAAHSRTFAVTPGGSFAVSVRAGIQGVATTLISQQITGLAVFTRGA